MSIKLDSTVIKDLTNNNNLNDIVKALLVELDFVSTHLGAVYFPNYNSKLLKYLDIKISTSLDKPCQLKGNTLYLNSTLLDNKDFEYDIPRYIMPEIIFPDTNNHGIFYGTKEIVTNNIYGNNSEPYNPHTTDEFVIANLLSSIVGIDTLISSVNTSNQDIIKQALLKQGIWFDKINSLLTAIDINYVNRYKTKKSNLANIQATLSEIFLISNKIKNETDIELFKANMVTIPILLDKNISYPNIEGSLDYFNNLITYKQKGI